MAAEKKQGARQQFCNVGEQIRPAIGGVHTAVWLRRRNSRGADRCRMILMYFNNTINNRGRGVSTLLTLWSSR
jgi:hypothetical protein